uniref:Uncharacterized protein n=1 Tax=Lotus japonicus TaxID=34305 RepID=I3SKE0_LOTJA|nr:unknown [Lotus japonicus]
MRHCRVPKATDRENLTIIILTWKFSKEFEYTRSTLARIPLLHSTKEASRVWAI